jgi:hypothetical protein
MDVMCHNEMDVVKATLYHSVTALRHDPGYGLDAVMT